MLKDRKLSIGYFADGPWAHKAFDLLAEDPSIHINFICVRYDHKDPVLMEKGTKAGIPVLYSENINSQDFMVEMTQYHTDLFVSMSFNQIFRRDMINFPPLKTINCHAGKLPFYRGRNILNWVLINDEKEFGITAHYVDEGIDTGDIIFQNVYPISDTDTYKTLLERAYIGCAEVLYQAIKQIQSGSVLTIKQNDIDPIGIYCGMRKPGDEVINWNQTSREIFNFIRALCLPGPQAITYVKNFEVKINKCRMVDGAHVYKNTVGQVVGITKEGFFVKTADTMVEIIEFSCERKIKIGDRLSDKRELI